ncbi:MAG: hypothetical protein A2081_06515 [Elusimicrobia bacterium GWC2_61_19]|nr:MAG: hypothetical protein A2081_06515 [Elusimicrobia bacterium GWC2_61_19]
MPELHPVYYFAAAALAAGLLAYRLLRRPGQPDEKAKQGSGLSEFGTDIRLRDLFRLAVLMEEQGKKFYIKMAVTAKDTETRKLCALLAEEEAAHGQLFQGHLDRWRPIGLNMRTWPAFLEKVKQEGFFADPPPADASEDEMAAYAIRQEIKTAEFYALFEQAFPEAWKKDHLRRLVEQEKRHERLLRAAYPRIH